ncbi:MAG: RICIN domain-containing protein [Umezawaea sp.]
MLVEIFRVRLFRSIARRAFATLSIVAAILVSLVTADVALAHADEPAPAGQGVSASVQGEPFALSGVTWARIQNAGTSGCLDSNLAGNAYVGPCTADNNYQRWYYAGDKQYLNYATNGCLTGSPNGYDVFTAPCNGRSSQKWYAVYVPGTDRFTFSNALYPFNCLESPSDGRLFTRDCAWGTSYQFWYLNSF